MDAHRHLESIFDLARRRIRLIDMALGGLVLILFTFSFFFGAVLLDHVLILERPFRIVLLAMYQAGAIALIIYFVLFPIFRGINQIYIARKIEEQHTDLKNRLVTYLQLAPDESEVIRTDISQNVARKMEGLAIQSIFTFRSLRPFAVGFIALSVLIYGYALLSPKSLTVSLKRTIYPNKVILPPTLTRITRVEPGDADILKGRPAEFWAQTEGAPPSGAQLVYSIDDGESWTPHPMVITSNGILKGTIVSPSENIRYYLVAGDTRSERYKIRIVNPPVVTTLAGELEFPAYTGLPKRTIEGGNINAIEGTKVVLHGETNVPVSKAVVTSSSGKPVEVSILAPTHIRLELSVSQNDIYQIILTSQQGHISNDPPRYRIIAQSDSPPEATIIQPARDIELSAGDALNLSIRMRDDFGLSKVLLRVKPRFEKERLLPLTIPDLRRETSAKVRVTLKSMGLAAGDYAAYSVVVEDNKPVTPNRGESETFTLHVTGDSEDQLALNDASAPDESEAGSPVPAVDSATDGELTQPAGTSRPPSDSGDATAVASAGDVDNTSTSNAAETPSAAETTRTRPSDDAETDNARAEDQSVQVDEERSQTASDDRSTDSSSDPSSPSDGESTDIPTATDTAATQGTEPPQNSTDDNAPSTATSTTQPSGDQDSSGENSRPGEQGETASDEATDSDPGQTGSQNQESSPDGARTTSSDTHTSGQGTQSADEGNEGLTSTSAESATARDGSTSDASNQGDASSANENPAVGDFPSRNNPGQPDGNDGRQASAGQSADSSASNDPGRASSGQESSSAQNSSDSARSTQPGDGSSSDGQRQAGTSGESTSESSDGQSSGQSSAANNSSTAQSSSSPGSDGQSSEANSAGSQGQATSPGQGDSSPSSGSSSSSGQSSSPSTASNAGSGQSSGSSSSSSDGSPSGDSGNGGSGSPAGASTPGPQTQQQSPPASTAATNANKSAGSDSRLDAGLAMPDVGAQEHSQQTKDVLLRLQSGGEDSLIDLLDSPDIDEKRWEELGFSADSARMFAKKLDELKALKKRGEQAPQLEEKLRELVEEALVKEQLVRRSGALAGDISGQTELSDVDTDDSSVVEAKLRNLPPQYRELAEEYFKSISEKKP